MHIIIFINLEYACVYVCEHVFVYVCAGVCTLVMLARRGVVSSYRDGSGGSEWCLIFQNFISTSALVPGGFLILDSPSPLRAI